jgi:tetratricopeptide (TPR) repeat protein
VLIAGGRAAEVEGPGTSWVFDIDPNEMFEEALHQIDAGRFESAVESFRLIEYPEDGDYEIEEYYVNLTYALMGMGDFHAAMAASFEYALADPDPENVNLLTGRLRLLGGIAAYYAGEDQIAYSSLDAYLEEEPLSSAAAEAISAKYNLLLEMDRDADAASLLREARRAQPGVDWDALTNQ